MEINKLYLFRGEKYQGYFDVFGEYDLVFHNVDCPLDLSSKRQINNWLSERIVPDERVDKSLCLLISGFPGNASDWTVLVEGHCTSTQDTFWWSKKKDASWYQENHWYPVSVREGLIKVKAFKSYS